jgi:sterol 24-C-methyltransferase
LSSSQDVKHGITDYSKLHREADAETRVSRYKQLVNTYYDLVTVFYEWGWCSSFHFSYRYDDKKCSMRETFLESIRRHEYTLAAQLTDCYGADKHVLDVGCGIAGPARTISKFLQCRVTGITLNPYQVQRGNELSAKDSMWSNVRSVEGDFMDVPRARSGQVLPSSLPGPQARRDLLQLRVVHDGQVRPDRCASSTTQEGH